MLAHHRHEFNRSISIEIGLDAQPRHFPSLHVQLGTDGIGGDMLAQALTVLKDYGTVILCGLISQYNDPSKAAGLSLASVILKRAVLKGLVVYDFEDQRQKFFDLVAPWINEGRVKYLEDRVDGLEHTGSQFARLMSGQNVGKALVVVGPESE